MFFHYSCLSRCNFLKLPLQEVLDKFDEKILYSLVLCYLKDRLYYNTNASATSWSDEEDERLKYSSSPGNSTLIAVTASSLTGIKIT